VVYSICIKLGRQIFRYRVNILVTQYFWIWRSEALDLNSSYIYSWLGTQAGYTFKRVFIIAYLKAGGANAAGIRIKRWHNMAWTPVQQRVVWQFKMKVSNIAFWIGFPLSLFALPIMHHWGNETHLFAAYQITFFYIFLQYIWLTFENVSTLFGVLE
jgi:hypothetical protein